MTKLLENLEQELILAQRKVEELQRSISIEKQQKSYSSSNSYHKKKKFLEENSKRILENLKVGDFVQVVSAGAGRIRKIMHIDLKSETFSGFHQKIDKKTKMFKDDAYITTHIASRITHVYVGDEFVSIKTFLENLEHGNV